MAENLDLALLLAVFSAERGIRIEGRTRIQKLVCLLQYADCIPFSFSFKPYYYGPFSDDLSDSINSLVGMRLIRETVTPTLYRSYRYDYELTEEGRRLLGRMEAQNEELTGRISRRVREYDDYNTSVLVRMAEEISGIPSIRG